MYHVIQRKAASAFAAQPNQLEDESWKSAYAWFERAGELPAGERSAFLQSSSDSFLSSISAAPDGSKIAVIRFSGQQNANIYVADLPPGREISKLLNIRRLTFTLADDYPHAWTPDNRAVIFESSRNGRFGLFRQTIDQQEAEPLVLTNNADNALAQASSDGKWILYREEREQRRKRRLMRVPMNGGTPEPLPGTENVEVFFCGPGGRIALCLPFHGKRSVRFL